MSFLKDLRFQDPEGLVNRAAFNERFETLNRLNVTLGNEWVWEKRLHTEEWTEYKTINIWSSSGNTTIYYGKTKALGEQRAVGDVNTITSVCAGYYFKVHGDDTLYYGQPDGVCTIVNGYFVFPAKEFISESDDISYLNSPDPTAYPPSEPDGYTYIPLGQLGDKVRIATGSYIGTGTYGSANPNTLTFDFEPKLVMIFCKDSIFQLFMARGSSVAYSLRKENSNTDNSAKTSPITVSFVGKSISWYGSDSSWYQGNGTTDYYFIALG